MKNFKKAFHDLSNRKTNSPKKIRKIKLFFHKTA